MLRIYTFIILLYYCIVSVYSFFNEKAKRWKKGQKIWRADLEKIKGLKNPIWFHCASVGEFEQARPIIEHIRSFYPDSQMFLTFYSPSGYELRCTYDKVDAVTYLPLDLHSNVTSFLDTLRPSAAIFIKYELWFNFMEEIYQRRIPFALVSAHFNKNHWLASGFGQYFGKRLRQFDKIFLQDESSKEVLKSLNLNNLDVVGDTRFDRVRQVASSHFEHDLLSRFTAEHEVLVAGSTWIEDMDVLMPIIKSNPKLRVIVAPHELKSNQWLIWKSNFGNEIIPLSEFSDSKLVKIRIVYIDQIGLLSKLYRYATFAYVGGGFGQNVHNTLEAAVYGIPVFFGPKNKRFAEIQLLKTIGAGIEVDNGEDLKSKVQSSSSSNYSEIANRLKSFFAEHEGATLAIIQWMDKEGIIRHKKTPSEEEA